MRERLQRVAGPRYTYDVITDVSHQELSILLIISPIVPGILGKSIEIINKGPDSSAKAFRKVLPALLILSMISPKSIEND